MKIVSPDILHKSDIGSVRLGVSNAAEVQTAFRQIMDVECIAQITELAQALKSDLESLEINPLWVNGSQIEALDAVITWQKR